MKFRLILHLFLIWAMLAVSLYCQDHLLDQKNPILQSYPDQHISLNNIKKLTFDSVKTITKLIWRNDRVYILDELLSVIHVFNDRQILISTIGRPGQGPGDFENPQDMFISEAGTIYVLNPQVRRFEVFNHDEKYRDRIAFSPPKEAPYSKPDNFLVLPNHEILISYELSPYYLYYYDSTGNYLRATAPRNIPITIPGTNLGNTSDLLLKNNGDIVLFNRFSGVFTLLSPSGKIKKEFSAYSEIHKKNIALVLNSKPKEKSSPGIRIQQIYQWTNACRDEKDNIYVFSLFDIDNHMQNMYVFSPEGEFLYRKTFPFFNKIGIRGIYCYGNVFYFITGKYGNEEVFYFQQEDTI